MSSLAAHLLWLKAFHVVFVVTWFAGLFYLPRLFVYHAVATDAPGIERFKVMERRLYILMSMGASLATLFGILMLMAAPGYLHMGWVHAKLTLVLLLIGYHLWCRQLVRAFAADRNPHSQRWYRWFNEAPSLLLIAIVVLAVVKPF
ncbi:MAG: protoporphyrinogen oxidase HemJ [Steroidobacteraceae bacterium]